MLILAQIYFNKYKQLINITQQQTQSDFYLSTLVMQDRYQLEKIKRIKKDNDTKCNNDHQQLKNDVHIFRIFNRMFIDFNLLASQYPKLHQHLVILGYKTTINFRCQQSLIVLTQAIMKVIFNIIFFCPKNNLCPRVPNRINYLIWVNKYVPIKISTLMDVGTGATAIYPLLGWSLFKWRSIAIQSNSQSSVNAQQLVKNNKLERQIKIIKTEVKNQILKIDCNNLESHFHIVDVVICNPPFYQSQENIQDFQLQQQYQNRKPISTMLMSQYQTEGGEYNFFFQMYRQSFKYVYKNKASLNIDKDQKAQTIKFKFFTCLLGRQTSFNEIAKFLAYEMTENVLEMYKLGEIRQGSNARFVVMWRPKYI